MSILEKSAEMLSTVTINIVLFLVLLICPVYEVYHDLIIQDKYNTITATVIKKYVDPENDRHYERLVADILYKDGTKDYRIYSDSNKYNVIAVGDVIKMEQENQNYIFIICLLAYLEYICLVIYAFIKFLMSLD